MRLRILAYMLGVVLLLAALGAGYVAYTLWRHGVFEEPVYESTPPELPELPTAPRVLVFSKTNSFRHVDAIPAANEMIGAFAQELGWSVFHTENAAIASGDLLGKFDLAIWNNVSGDVFTAEQRAAFRAWVEGGGKVLAFHASGGDPVYGWEWYPTEFIRAQFIGHPGVPQFQNAVVQVEDRDHPATKHLPERWDFKDEWYSFAASPRGKVNVLATLDENTYSPALAGPLGSLRMGDHPIIWWHEVGEGTVFYSALGHRAEAYQDADYRQLLKAAAVWLLAR